MSAADPQTTNSLTVTARVPGTLTGGLMDGSDWDSFDPHRLLPGTHRTETDLVRAWAGSARRREHLVAFCLLKDRYYRALWARTNTGHLTPRAVLAGLVEAGFIVEDHDPTLGLWATQPVLAGVPTNDHDGVVLVLSGVFDPFHDGHAHAIEAAHHILTHERGVPVAACVISPCHDDYAAYKRPDFTPGPQRAAQVLTHGAQVPLLLTSNVETSAVTPLNFTTVLTRIADSTGRKVVFVFGEDNAAFAGAFTSADEWVCVIRPGHTQDRVPVVGTGVHMSSTMLRAARTLARPDRDPA